MRRALGRGQGWILASLTVGVSFAIASGIALATTLPDHDDFNAVRWELRHVPGKWLYLAGRFLEGGLSRQEEDERLGGFLLLSAQVRELGATFSGDDLAQVAELRRLLGERSELENDAEAVLEGRLTAVLEDAGLESSLPLFPDARWVFPPVDVEFDEAPRSLAISARDRIELLERRPLRPGLSLEEAVAREAAVEEAGDRSALVGSLAGVATYPSIVEPHGDYERLVSTVAHEWVHQYLFFRPLGRRYYDSVELRTLNETVADIAGQLLARALVERYPLPPPVVGALLAPRAAPEIDLDAALRELRVEVDDLLAAGEIDAAEALMEERRLELAERGVVFRRINQAFFASRSLYADTPGAIDETASKLRALLNRTGSVGGFLRAAAEFENLDDLDAKLSEGPPKARSGPVPFIEIQE